jgi:threonine dehydratase
VTATPAGIDVPTLERIQLARRTLGADVRETPTWLWRGHRLAARVGEETAVHLKLELFQHTGSFKPRGALMVLRSLPRDQLARGVTAVSAGNHAMAVAYGARVVGTNAKVAMPESANPARVEACRALGAEVVLVPDIAAAFAETERLQRDEGRAFVHPYEGPLTALGTATLGLELLRQTGQLDALFVSIGGGGLAAGVACAVKQLQPRCRVYGVEPAGADSMHRSFAAVQLRAVPALRRRARQGRRPGDLRRDGAVVRRREARGRAGRRGGDGGAAAAARTVARRAGRRRRLRRQRRSDDVRAVPRAWARRDPVVADEARIAQVLVSAA